MAHASRNTPNACKLSPPSPPCFPEGWPIHTHPELLHFIYAFIVLRSDETGLLPPAVHISHEPLHRLSIAAHSIHLNLAPLHPTLII